MTEKYLFLTPLELPNAIRIMGQLFGGERFSRYATLTENLFFSLLAGCALSWVAYRASRKMSLVPGRLQNGVELIIGFFDDFVCGILGPQGRRFTPFIGTLFLYILSMNLVGVVPFMKSSTSSLSTTAALAVCVFGYVQVTAIRENGLFGYIDHMMGRPRGVIAFTLFIPALIFVIHLVTELVRPLTLALRLRSNIWAEDALLAVAASFGLAGIPLLIFSMALAILSSIIQATVFCLLTTIYFALALPMEDQFADSKK